MKRTIAFMAASLFLADATLGASRDAQWQQVDEAIQKGLPQTAIQQLDPILKGAIRDRAWGEAAKAIARKVALEAQVQGGNPLEHIRLFEAELDQAPAETLPILRTILAEAYWDYFRANRWRFLQRTATAQSPGNDIATWDLPRLFAEIDRRFTTALASPDIRNVPIARFNDLLAPGTVPDTYRPTLFDFVAHQALAFYTSGEQAGALPQDAFQLAADTPVFDPTDAFLRWRPTPAPSNSSTATPQDRPLAIESPALKAIRLYQELLRFHVSDADRSAFLDVDLARLLWAKNTAFGEDKLERFKTALKRFVDANADHDLASLALYHWAHTLHEEGDFLQARQLAIRARQIHPKSPGAKLAVNLIAEIEARSATTIAERIWNKPWPAIEVRYRNVDQVHFRLIPWNWDVFLEPKHRRPENLSEAERNQVLARTPSRAWSQSLPPTADFKEHRFHAPIPTDIEPGFYFLAASHRPDFLPGQNQLSLTDVWVSDLALVLRTAPGEIGGFVLDAASGDPIPGAQVQAWHLDNAGRRIPVPTMTTDTNGAFLFRPAQPRGYLIKASARGQQLATADECHTWNQRENTRPIEKTFLFTDRALYRPGQTIQYKGICLRADTQSDQYTVLVNRQLTVVFYDVNRKEIARQSHRANDYGSISGSFTAPRDRLAGRMQLRALDGPGGQTWVRVEEYKRPKFQVTLDAPKDGAKLGDRVDLTGHALSYTGAAVDGANVQYRVVREIRWPPWWGWFSWRARTPLGESQEIAHGAATTDTDGAFRIGFTANPDPKVPPKDAPTFVYSVHADVTDSAGETRSAERGVRLAYTALQANVTAADWLTEAHPVELQVHTSTLDNEPQPAEGVLRIHALKSPERPIRPPLANPAVPYFHLEPRPDGPPDNDPSDPNQWELGPVVFEKGLQTDKDGKAQIATQLPVGAYRVVFDTQDRYGKPVTALRPLTVVNPDSARFSVKIPHFLEARAWRVEAGDEFAALWGTGYERGRAFVEIEHRGRVIQRYWTQPEATQVLVRQSVTPAMRGGFTLRVTQVCENRAYLDSRPIDVPWTDRELKLKWEHFTSKLQPGRPETWTLVVQPPTPTRDASPSATTQRGFAEVAAALYDASLDAFAPHHWPTGFGVFRTDASRLTSDFTNANRPLEVFHIDWQLQLEDVELSYRTFPPGLAGGGMPINMLLRYGLKSAPVPTMAAPARMAAGVPLEESVADAAGAIVMRGGAPAAKSMALARPAMADPEAAPPAAEPPPAGPDLANISARRNLNETAFFFPHLTTDENGAARLTFTMPEALTEWRFLGFAHDRTLAAGSLTDKTVTAKDLMVQPNPPRFLREGDSLEFTVKLLNQSDRPQRGRIRLAFNDALTEKSADALLRNRSPELAFDLTPRQSRSFAWRLTVPDGLSVLSYKAVAATDTLSDGEEGLVPVLPRRILVTESLPLAVLGPATNRVEFAPLLQSGKSKSLEHHSLTVQMVSNPAWYAVMALPYLIEFPYECNEQTFNRFYANSLARFIANSDPRIRRVFDLWKATPALDSPLEKNQDIKSVLLEESPWVRQARSESEARQNVGILFDDNRLNTELQAATRKLLEAQLNDGAWPWFPGGPPSDYITLYIVTGFGRLRHLGADVSPAPAIRALERLDRWIEQVYRDLQKETSPGANHLSPTAALYLYARSFFLKDQPIPASAQPAVDYFLDQARRYWIQARARQTQGHLALSLKRFGDLDAARAILNSLKERSVTDPELGRFWRETEASWWWHDAPIETQALMIEVFDEVGRDADAVEGCKVWLLKQKQTQNWNTTKATADAVYALLLRGRDLLSSQRLVEVDLGGVPIRTPQPNALDKPNAKTPASQAAPAAVEPGTGFYEKRFGAAEIASRMGRITVRKTEPGVSWGSVHWQYLDDIAQVPAYATTPLKLKKTLFTRRNTINGPVLERVSGPVKVGDELIVRLELRTDREMEFVHLKDLRGSGTEPVNVLSGYRFQDGLGYYESTRDSATHFFFDRLRPGTYVIEYPLRVQHRGEYPAGIASIQCMYAPEFNSHSDSTQLEVR